MKKTVLLILYCFGAMLLIHSARSAEPVFGGEIILGGAWENTRRSLLDASNGIDRIDSLTENEDREAVWFITGYHFQPLVYSKD